VLIVSDRNIPFVEEAFAELGDVRTLRAAEIDATAVRDADLLLCRSTIKVGSALLDGSRVRFVATATIGTDHLDLPYLASRGITWASAPGSNADSVALWWACAIANVSRRFDLDPTSMVVGVVGVGHVGRRIAALAEALGTRPALCDPPRARAESGGGFVTLDELLPECHVVSLHVPLNEDGPDATRGLIGAARIERMRPRALLVNACRGEVVDAAALTEALSAQRLRAVLDVFPGEPRPDPRLVGLAALATPHIAGHSLDGKVNGTDAIYRAACAFLGKPATFSARATLGPPAARPHRLSVLGQSDAAALDEVLRPIYDISVDDAALRKIVAQPEPDRAAAFRAYRDGYPPRREPRGLEIDIHPRRTNVRKVLSCLGAVVGNP
jgi:erythronate-4-phosphate dehydrogenase